MARGREARRARPVQWLGLGTADHLASTLVELGRAGLSQVMLLPPLATRDQVLRDVAEHVMPLLESIS